MLVVLAGNALFVPFSALLAASWAWRSRTPWRNIGFVRPANWLIVLAFGTLGGVAFKIAMKAVVMPLFGADPANHAYHYLEGNTAALPGAIYAMTVGAGFGEETIFRGYLFERLGRLWGDSSPARLATVLLTSAYFGAVHYAVQGMTGAGQAAIVGLVFGTIYARTGRLVPLMVAHAAFDLTALALIFFGLESNVAHLIFTQP